MIKAAVMNAPVSNSSITATGTPMCIISRNRAPLNPCHHDTGQARRKSADRRIHA